MDRRCEEQNSINASLLLLIDEADDVLSFDELHVLDFISNLLKYLCGVLAFLFDFLDGNHFHRYVFLRVLIYALVHCAICTVPEHFILVDHIIVDDLVRLRLLLLLLLKTAGLHSNYDSDSVAKS